MKVAAIQFRPKFKDKESNLRKLASLVVDASKTGARVVVLPELCTTGYSFLSHREAADLAEPIVAGARTFDVMQQLSHRLNLVIAWGMVERDAGTGKLYNSQVMVTPRDGYVSYRKVNLWGNDFIWAQPGRGSPPILRVSFGVATYRLGLLICRDVRDKSRGIPDLYEKGDADAVLFSANWGRGGFPAVAWMDFVQDNGMSLVVANRHGVEEHNDFGMGGSCIVLPGGVVITDGLVMGQDCIVTGEI